MTLKERLRHHVSGAIERGEGVAIEAIEAPLTLATLDDAQRKCLGFDLPPEKNRFINTHEVQ